jgi:hypothetical protein
MFDEYYSPAGTRYRDRCIDGVQCIRQWILRCAAASESLRYQLQLARKLRAVSTRDAKTLGGRLPEVLITFPNSTASSATFPASLSLGEDNGSKPPARPRCF